MHNTVRLSHNLIGSNVITGGITRHRRQKKAMCRMIILLSHVGQIQRIFQMDLHCNPYPFGSKSMRDVRSESKRKMLDERVPGM